MSLVDILTASCENHAVLFSLVRFVSFRTTAERPSLGRVSRKRVTPIFASFFQNDARSVPNSRKNLRRQRGTSRVHQTTARNSSMVNSTCSGDSSVHAHDNWYLRVSIHVEVKTVTFRVMVYNLKVVDPQLSLVTPDTFMWPQTWNWESSSHCDLLLESGWVCC